VGEVKQNLAEETAEWVPKGRELVALFEHARRSGDLTASWWFSRPHRPLELEFDIVTEDEEVKRELVSCLIFARASFEEAAREAIFGAQKGLDLHHVPLRFHDRYYSLQTRFDPEGNKFHVQVSGAPPGSPDPAISADEAGGTEERNK
jgi:hypothetical protein